MTGYYTIQKIAALHDNFDLKKQTSIQKCQLAFIPLVKKPISVVKRTNSMFYREHIFTCTIFVRVNEFKNRCKLFQKICLTLPIAIASEIKIN